MLKVHRDKRGLQPTAKGKQKVRIKIYDILGRIRQTLIDNEQEPGYYRITFTPKEYPAGIYFLRFQAGKYKKTTKMVIVK